MLGSAIGYERGTQRGLCLAHEWRLGTHKPRWPMAMRAGCCMPPLPPLMSPWPPDSD